MIQPKSTEKLTDKAFSRLMLTSVLGIFITLAALCSVTWAWFGTEISSPSNDIKSSYCNIEAFVTSENDEAISVDGKYLLAEDIAYTITITAEGTAKCAYCILKIDGNEYYTELISIQSAEKQISFALQFKGLTEVEIIPRWGCSSTAATFENGGSYLDLQKVDSFSSVASETTAEAETTLAEPSETEPALPETTAEAETTLAELSETEPALPETTAEAETTLAELSETEPALPETTAEAETTLAEPSETEPALPETTAEAETTLAEPSETEPATDSPETTESF